MVSLPVVLLIFISSNSPQSSLKEGILAPPTALPEKGFVDNGKSPKDYSAQVNDLTASSLKFPDDHSRGLLVSGKKIIQEKLMPDDFRSSSLNTTDDDLLGKFSYLTEERKSDKNKTPVPLYSLVKNDCGEGYALDENGVCQKTIAVRSGKKLDADRRRKRQVLNFERLIQRKPMKTNNERDSREKTIECNNLYPGLGAGKDGGCTKATGTSEEPFDKALPP